MQISVGQITGFTGYPSRINWYGLSSLRTELSHLIITQVKIRPAVFLLLNYSSILDRVELNIRRVQIKAERISANYYLTDVQTVV